jgi:ADP-heptose:LPS heptosyltransferase
MPDPSPRILVIQLKRIGDLILTAPLVARIRAERPDAWITLAVCDAAGDLAPCVPGVDEVLHFRRGRVNAGYWGGLLRGRPFDIALDCDGTDRSAATAWLSAAPVRVTHAKHLKSFPRNRIFHRGCAASLKEFHTTDHLGALAETAGIGGSTPPLRLTVPEADLTATAALGLPPRYVVVHPGSARIEKFWVAERWAGLIDHLTLSCGLPVVVTGGPWDVEQRHLAEIAERSQQGFRNLAKKTSVAAMAAVISQAALAVTVDTGALHLAAAFQIPQVALFGPTNPFRWGPRHARSWIVRAGKPGPLPGTHAFPKADDFAPMEAISLDEVIAAVARAQTPS